MAILPRLRTFRNLLLGLVTLGLVILITNYKTVSIAAMTTPVTTGITTGMTNRNPINNATTADHQVIALALVNQLIQGNFTEAFASFSPAMQQNVTVAEIQQAWTAITQELGEFQEIREINRQILGGREMFAVVCQFAKDSLRVQVGVNGDRQISGLYFIPIQAAQTFAPQP